MRRLTTLATLVVMSSVAALTMHAQVVAGPGTRIRVYTQGGTKGIEGTMVSRTADTLVVTGREGGLLRVPAIAVTRLDVLDGRRRGQTALKYAAIGGLVWGAVVAALPHKEVECDSDRYFYCSEPLSKGEVVVSQALGMAMIAGIVGAVKGSNNWVTVESSAIRVGVRPASGSIALSLTTRF